tara:strand:- start:98 stop:769 length:672 start_codon:yes stop_codon:yes gene_type:complete
MSLKERYKIRPIEYSLAMQLVVKNHYLHRRCPCSQAFGLFEKSDKGVDLFSNERIAGCIVYGTPSSAPLRSGICGEDERFNVAELTRLWIEDGTPKNSESYLIGNTIKLVKKEIIVSYAEIEQGHTGVVYQATNWIYTGLSAKRTNWKIEGLDKHCQTIADKHTSKELTQICGDRFVTVPRPRKHRYIYLNAGKHRKRELLQKLNYEIQPYPKNTHETELLLR